MSGWPSSQRGLRKMGDCDRFADSTRVYQGALGSVDRRVIKGLERVTIGDLSPI